MAITTDDLVKVVFYTRLGSQNGLMVHYYHCTSHVGTGGLTGTFADDIDTLVGPKIKAALSSAASYRGCTAQKVTGVSEDPVLGNGEAGAGGVAGDPLSSQTACVIALRTGLAGRRFKGRKYVMFPSEGSNDANAKPSAAYKALISDLLVAIATTVVTVNGGNNATMTPVVYSRVGNNKTPIIGGVIRENWGTMRRRSQINRGDFELP